MFNSENITNPVRRLSPREKSPSAKFVTFALEVLGSLLVLVLLNSFALWYLGNYSPNYGYWTLQQKWALLGKMDAPVDWLILGDSSCNQGVSPALIQEKLGETAINLCTIGNVTALNDVWMLEDYIRRFGPPQGVVIGHVYDVWSRDLDPLILGQIPRPWNFWKEHTLGSDLLGAPDLRSQLFQERYVPFLSQRLTLTSLLRSLMFGKLTPFKPRWLLDEYGFLKGEQAQPEIAIQDAQDHMQFVRENEPDLSSINQQALERLVEIANAYQLPIYLVNSPLYEGLSADDGFQAYLGALTGQIDSVVGESQSVHRIAEIKTFPAAQLQTADHLTLAGAQVYTEWLIQNVLNR
jgi:hypothetical protein